MASTENERTKAEMLGARYYIYQMFHSIFGVKPNPRQFEALKDSATAEAFAIYLPERSDETDARLKRLLETEFSEDFADQYVRSFEGPGQMIAPPWESVYVNPQPLLFQESTIDARKQYLAQGYIPQQFPHVPDDQLSLELDFMTQLAVRACEAERTGDEKACREALTASQMFLDTHLGRWTQAFAERLEEGGQEHFAAMARLLEAFVAADGRWLEAALTA